ncbi:hypothetical protein [Helicobacter cetorum]|uniref:hypothetical protein n=1 Tax=Helicobacter cetorum TaxID=138563 RepID=UPI000CF13514|nr:hypothetical protein [Helicobacter cetorum]
MKNFKALSLCALLSLGVFSQVAYAEKLQDTTNYPDWVKANLFAQDNPLNQYMGSASITDKHQFFYAQYVHYDEKISPEKNAEKIALLRARMNAYGTLESLFLVKKARKRIYEALKTKSENIDTIFYLIDFLVSKSVVIETFTDKKENRVYVMTQFPRIQSSDLVNFLSQKGIKISKETSKDLSMVLESLLLLS